jgi:glycosyltransferase involved in cell wall biosynthesis
LDIYPAVRRDVTDFNWARKRDIYAQSRLYVTAPSHWLLEKAKASMLDGVTYKMIPNAIDLNVFQFGDQQTAREILNLPERAKIVLLIAHSVFKDLELMKRAMTQVKGSDQPLLVLCLGQEGKEQPLGLGSLRYLGYEHDQQRVALYYQASDVYVHVAQDEAFGKTIVEAMACGTPVVGAATSAIPELILDGQTGLLVQPDAMSVATAVAKLLSDNKLRAKMGRQAKVHAQQYSLDQQADSFLRWYQEVLHDWQEWRSIQKVDNTLLPG